MERIDLRDLVAFSEDGPVHREVAATDRLWSELVCLEPNQRVGPIGDRDSDALCTVVAGRVVVQVGKGRERLGQWEVATVPAGSSLSLANAGEEPAVVLLVAAPPPTERRVDG
ncbi:MAG: cupin domain-containing protein [Actinomycetota bacterium]